MIVVLCGPIYGWAARRICCLVDRFDQGATNTFAACFGHGIKILQVDHVFNAPVVPMKDVVCQANELAVHLGNKARVVLRVIT